MTKGQAADSLEEPLHLCLFIQYCCKWPCPQRSGLISRELMESTSSILSHKTHTGHAPPVAFTLGYQKDTEYHFIVVL